MNVSRQDDSIWWSSRAVRKYDDNTREEKRDTAAAAAAALALSSKLKRRRRRQRWASFILQSNPENVPTVCVCAFIMGTHHALKETEMNDRIKKTCRALSTDRVAYYDRIGKGKKKHVALHHLFIAAWTLSTATATTTTTTKEES